MAYDLVKQKHPGAPSAIGARVRHKETGRQGNIVHPVAGQQGVRVRFDGEPFPKACDPQALAYADDAPTASRPWVMQ